jgi:dinuclear metal center YbgI/SA1388 family protein
MPTILELENYTGQLLDATRFRDYCPNGLQVEGRADVRTLVSGVTASLLLIEAAIEADADAILVHHGYFWRSEPAPVVGVKRRRLGLLLQHDINLLAYHLPLDAHPDLGNNAQLGRELGFALDSWVGDPAIIACGRPTIETDLAGLAMHVENVLGRKPLTIGTAGRPVRRIAWCTGAGQDYFPEAIAQGVDAFVTGEISEQTVHLARETGVAFISAGHHATERYGVQALGRHLAERFGLEHRFVDIDNPV